MIRLLQGPLHACACKVIHVETTRSEAIRLRRAGSAWLMLSLVVAGTVIGLMGTDLVLPAVPWLPAALGGSVSQAQFVLAGYVGGSCVGLLLYGALGDRYSTRRLFVGSLLATALICVACALVRNLQALIALRVLQGAAAAGPAVFAPGIVKALFDERGSMQALGVLGSIEALAPALAPLLGIWLVATGGWQLTFLVLAGAALLLALLLGSRMPLPQTARRAAGGYRHLLRDRVFLRYALSQALVLGGLLVFVFGMPTVFVHALGQGMQGFVIMQMVGIATFMAAANSAGRLVDRFGAERMISTGTMLAALGGLGLLGYGLAGGRSALVIAALFVPLNTGLGLRGPPGFFHAVLAARGDDARGAALVILFILGITTAGTVIAAPWLLHGVAPLAAITCALQLLGVASLLLPRLQR